jgi:hypothetical protein
MAKEEPHWGEETCLPFSGTLPLGKAGLLLLCCAPEDGGTFLSNGTVFALEGGGTFVAFGIWWPSILIFSIVQN